MIDLKAYIDEGGVITAIPAKRQKYAALLQYLSSKFEDEKDYSEKEINAIIDEWHSFGDYFILRRGLIDEGLLCRTNDGTRYWKAEIKTET